MDDFPFTTPAPGDSPAVVLLENDPGEVLRVKQLFAKQVPGFKKSIIHLSSLAVAINYLKAHPAVGVVLTTTTLPEAKGVEVVKMLRDAAPKARIISLSVVRDEVDCQALTRAGADDCLDKNHLIPSFFSALIPLKTI